MGINPQNSRSNFGVLEGEKLTVAVILGGGLLARLEGGEELGFWVHGPWGGAWLLDGFRWRVVVGWVWGLELEGGGHGGMENRGIRKVPGMSSVYVGCQVHQFSARDKSHPQTMEIYMKLDEMIQRLRLAGYVPNTGSQVFFGVDSRDDDADKLEEIGQALFCHSEKLAVCFGLISTRAGSTLYIFKNLWICVDCHSAMKIVSHVYNREIVIRDRNQFHCFKQGSCSCSDYW
ncbi:PREDICTED: pentatricopeptide [Prunus dulcis]|uniref:PREDICTED: pentatricopeptide n=1 Tax=Prunus dulcis TaxID=3755 RepID=A0A5E4FEB8_PRUDU|nr:PREDICTED: pentatricopeptide [Prunus dulcis]